MGFRIDVATDRKQVNRFKGKRGVRRYRITFQNKDLAQQWASKQCQALNGFGYRVVESN